MRLLILFAAMLFAPALSSAQESAYKAQPRYGIAMHGELKYGPDFEHLDYVNPNAPKGGTYRSHAIGTFDSLNPFIVKGTPAAGLTYLGGNLLYEPLMEQTWDEPFSQYGVIAETIEVPDDNTWVAFNLRPEARWHDGAPLTAEDVKWTFQTLMEHGLPFYKAYYGDVDQVLTEGENRIVFTFNHGDNKELPLILSQLPVLPKHYWAAEGRDITRTTLEPPPGSGPYKIAGVSPGRSVTYERIENWWGADLPINRGKFNYDRVVYEYYRDANVALEAFFAGEYDAREENTAKLWATAYDAPPVRDGRITKATIPHDRPAGMQGFLYNIRRPVFEDQAVRRALDYAFDFEWSNKQFAYGEYTRSNSYFENSELASEDGPPTGRVLEILEPFRDRLPASVFEGRYQPPETDGSGNYRANLRTAAQILNDAGWKMGTDGVREKDGVKLQFEILDSNPQFERWVLPFVQNLERIGVKANFRVVDSAQYVNRINDFDFDMTIGTIPQSSSPGNEQRDFWASGKADTPGSRNMIGVKNPVIDELVEMVIVAPTRDELVARTRALDRVLLAYNYVIPQWHIDHWRIAWWNKLKKPEELSGLTPGISTTWWVEE
ncbi:MAG: ABC transporter substrate-binding protein [Alphaproteobacteria bacterium]|nr:ABC transporter substrate-binding protein [Alphaproteobacteria bacterium]